VQKGLESRILSTPIVVFSHMPVRMIYEPWWWETGEATQAIEYLRRFGSVTELNRHIHRIVSKGEGNITFHTARSTTFPQSTAGKWPRPGVAHDYARPVAQHAWRDIRHDRWSFPGRCASRFNDCIAARGSL
jgi:hypothetical protein